jgi:hypothetical protein
MDKPSIGLGPAATARSPASRAQCAWSYAAQMPIHCPTDYTHGGWYWLEVHLRVRAGQIGLAIATPAGELKGERLISADSSEVDFVFPFSNADNSLIIRNGSLAERSVVDLLEAKAYGMAISDSLPLDAA